ncbi:MAG: hypothetical protein N2439_09735 [Anaerolineae bacterium]|nr:hypothetical protein [Anaerolineae bacterium]
MRTSLTDYWLSLAAAFADAERQHPIAERTFQMAGVCFRLRLAGPALAEALLPALAHLPNADDAAGPTVTFDLWDGAATGVWPPRPPFTAADYHRYGQRAIACDDDGRSLMYAPAVGQLFAYDRATRHGYFWAEDASQLSIYDRAAPLQTLFHWALAEFGWQLVHAAGVGREAGGVLLIGNTGAGKSTTALSCLAGDGLRLLSDDKCLVRLAPAPEGFAAFSSAKIKGDMLEQWPHFRPRLAGWDEQAKGGKGLLFLYPDFAGRLITTFPIRALVVSCVTHQAEPVLRPLAPGEAFRVFGPSTVIWLPGAEAENYHFAAELIRRLPCYRLDLAREPARNGEAILALLEHLL